MNEQSDKSPSLAPEWSARHGFKPFGDRINFLSPEVQHLHTGRLKILPARGDKTSVRPSKVKS